MTRTSSPSRSFWLTLIVLTLLVNLGATWSSYLRWHTLGMNVFRSVWGIPAAVYVGMIVACLWLVVLLLRPGGSQVDSISRFKFFQSDRISARLLGWIIFLAVLFLIPYIKFTLRVGRDDNPLHVDRTL